MNDFDFAEDVSRASRESSVPVAPIGQPIATKSSTFSAKSRVAATEELDDLFDELACDVVDALKSGD